MNIAISAVDSRVGVGVCLLYPRMAANQQLSLLRRAYEQRFVESFTDDASVVEALGEKVSGVEGNRENIKITTPFDMLVAKTLIECWTSQQGI